MQRNAASRDDEFADLLASTYRLDSDRTSQLWVFAQLYGAATGIAGPDSDVELLEPTVIDVLPETRTRRRRTRFTTALTIDGISIDGEVETYFLHLGTGLETGPHHDVTLRHHDNGTRITSRDQLV